MKVQGANLVYKRGETNRAVSVIIPLYNYEHFIGQTLNSVMEQSFRDVALIVVDDGSRDASCQVVQAWMKGQSATDISLMLLANTSNAGLSITRNTGLEHSQSKLCFFLDADNILFPNCISRHFEACQARPDAVGSYSLIEEFGGKSGLIGNNAFDRDTLKFGNYIDAMTMIRRQPLVDLGGFLPIKHGWEDYELWLRMCEKDMQLVHIPNVLSRYRHHHSSMLRQHTNLDENIKQLHKNIERLHPWVQLSAPTKPPRSGNMATQANVTKPNEAAPRTQITAPRNLVEKKSRPKRTEQQGPYEEYRDKIIGKLNDVLAIPTANDDVEIDLDFTGPALGSPFETVASPSARDESERQIRRMIRAGIIAVNPRPGVHASRDNTGELLRYRCLSADATTISNLPDNFLVHIHTFYPDILEEILGYFSSTALNGRFIITTTTSKNFDDVEEILDNLVLPRAKTLLISNSGRDIGPFLDHIVDIANEGDVLVHVHTKKSPDVGGDYGVKWRKSLYGALLNQSAVDAFDERDLGLIFPDSSRAVGWGANRNYCQEIADRIDLELPFHPGPIPVGNMFAARFEVAKAMQDATSGMTWPREPVPYDGSILHAIERMWPQVCGKAGFDWAAIWRHDKEAKTT